ncbi:hypothetical protein EW145_g3828 [Phellinidium pouzarii]|uniref:Lipoyl-binding domain-containing protein n=1 Tax=Phellinidium pouzarii TaxID=167371 RepID=A0A4S4L5Z7_9AGAM|nr:hypothetical protein EW145_g3828 [Phellinidium pouzarii]
MLALLTIHFQKFLMPHLRPPTSTAYESDRDSLTEQFNAAEALLKEIQTETAAVRQAVEDQNLKVEQTTQDVDACVKEMREGETKARDEMREIREEVNSIREMLPKMIEKNKESQTQSLSELQQELKSLKALLLSRGPSQPTTPSPSLSSFTGRPSIPSWQLEGYSSTDLGSRTDRNSTVVSSTRVASVASSDLLEEGLSFSTDTQPRNETALRSVSRSSLRVPSYAASHRQQRVLSPFIRTLVTKKYTTDHEAIVFDDTTNIGTIFITEYAQESLGDVVFVELPSEGFRVAAGDQIGAVESVKAASDIYSPVSGTVDEINGGLGEQPNLINKSPEDKGPETCSPTFQLIIQMRFYFYSMALQN